MAFLDGRTFENGKIFIELLGSFWTIWFPDQVPLKGLFDGVGNMHYDNYLQTLQMCDTLSKETVPVHSLHNWYFLTIKKSDIYSADALKRLYGTNGLVYGPKGGTYGQLAFDKFASYPLSSEFKGCTHFYNRLLDPSLVLTDDIDYFIDADRGVISFRNDPFDDPLISKRTILDDEGNEEDEEIALWGHNVQIDKQHIWTHFGYVLNIWMQSSPLYRQFISALWDMLVQGPSKTAMKLGLSAVTGVPVALSDEVVERIDTYTDRLLITTDKNVYAFKPTATPVVSIGTELHLGDTLVDAFRIIIPNSNADWSAIRAISLGDRFLGMQMRGPITFENKEVSLNYLGKDTNGRSIVQFDVHGWIDDIDRFWKMVHTKGLADGKTLAEYLDTRKNAPTQPDTRDLPVQINPFEFVVNNLFRNNMYLITMKPQDFADNAPGLSNMSHVYKYLPPHTAYVIFIEFTPDTDYYETSKLDDSVEFLKAMDSPWDEIPISNNNDYAPEGMLIDRDITFKLVPERCR